MSKLVKSAAILCVAPLMFGLLSCTSETQRVGPTDIQFERPVLEKVSVTRVMRGETQIGWVEETRLVDGDNDDANNRHQYFVLDMNREKLGFITDDGRAYRYRAHYSPELMANHARFDNNVAAVIGASAGSLRLERELVQDD